MDVVLIMTEFVVVRTGVRFVAMVPTAQRAHVIINACVGRFYFRIMYKIHSGE